MANQTALYIHIPFCKSKCLYCDFPSFSGMENSMLQYSEALCTEIDRINKIKIGSIFIGGGTPTYLTLEGWKKIKNSIDRLIKDTDIEFTIEGNPGTFNGSNLLFFKQMGINRLSIGLQAWQNDLLKSLGRIHSLKEFLDGYNLAREIGFSNINIDLMFGLPSQTLKDWEETLENVIELNPEHISCYSLILEEGTQLMRLYENGKLTLPDEEVEREMYETALKILTKSGYHQYEISNFSKPGKECKHNLVYWSMKDYIGCGSGAHSYFDGIRYNNEADVNKYIKMISEDNSAVVESCKNSIEDDMEEFMFMGLRKIEGISISEFKKRFHRDINEIYGEVINKYINLGLLQRNLNKLSLTHDGVPLSNIVMSEFIL